MFIYTPLTILESEATNSHPRIWPKYVRTHCFLCFPIYEWKNMLLLKTLFNTNYIKIKKILKEVIEISLEEKI